MARAKGLATYPLPPAGSFGEACEIAAHQLLADVLAFHDYVIQYYGGSPNVLQPELLIGAVYRPFTVIGDAFACPTGLEQGAALLHSLVKNHPFEDGNKRTGLMGCLYFLQRVVSGATLSS